MSAHGSGVPVQDEVLQAQPRSVEQAVEVVFSAHRSAVPLHVLVLVS